MAEITLNRDISYNETGALSKESEEGLLYRDMENDLVLQVQRRLAAIRQI
jgi:LPS-assembly lipoprotein